MLKTSRWRHTIDIANEWKQAEKREISATQLANTIAAKLRQCPINGADDMAEQFECFAHAVDGATDDNVWEDFDGNLDELYHWADTNKVWIERFKEQS